MEMEMATLEMVKERDIFEGKGDVQGDVYGESIPRESTLEGLGMAWI